MPLPIDLSLLVLAAVVVGTVLSVGAAQVLASAIVALLGGGSGRRLSA